MIAIKADKIKALGDNPAVPKLKNILDPRVEKAVHKDAKLRTFIADDGSRGNLVTHGYDVTYGLIRNERTPVLLDDSIVRGIRSATASSGLLPVCGQRKSSSCRAPHKSVTLIATASIYVKNERLRGTFRPWSLC
ncbi:MAG: hypothetical protein R2825_03755 [Saprospiraceae bacterium]